LESYTIFALLRQEMRGAGVLLSAAALAAVARAAVTDPVDIFVAGEPPEVLA
jgi:sialidase-1